MSLPSGPAAEAQSGRLPTYAVGEEIQIEGRTFTVMAILSPLQPMVAGTTPAFDLPLVLQADVFTQLFPQNHLRKFYFNVADESLDAVSALLTDYQQTQAIGMNITSRQTMIDQYEAQTRSSSVMGYAISVVIALVGVLNFVNSMVTAIGLPEAGVRHDPKCGYDQTAAANHADLGGTLLRRYHAAPLLSAQRRRGRRPGPCDDRRWILYLPIHTLPPSSLHSDPSRFRLAHSCSLFSKPGKAEHRGTPSGP